MSGNNGVHGIYPVFYENDSAVTEVISGCCHYLFCTNYNIYEELRYFDIITDYR